MDINDKLNMKQRLMLLWQASRAPRTKIGPEHVECLKLVSLLQEQVMRGNRLLWVHIANEYSDQKKRFVYGQLMKALGKIKGAPDYIIAKDGRVLFLEMKAAKGRQSDEQKFFGQWSAYAGISYEIAYSFQEAEAILKKHNFIID